MHYFAQKEINIISYFLGSNTTAYFNTLTFPNTACILQKKLTQVWNDMRVNRWWQVSCFSFSFFFLVDNSFNSTKWELNEYEKQIWEEKGNRTKTLPWCLERHILSICVDWSLRSVSPISISFVKWKFHKNLDVKLDNYPSLKLHPWNLHTPKPWKRTPTENDSIWEHFWLAKSGWAVPLTHFCGFWV